LEDQAIQVVSGLNDLLFISSKVQGLLPSTIVILDDG